MSSFSFSWVAANGAAEAGGGRSSNATDAREATVTIPLGRGGGEVAGMSGGSWPQVGWLTEENGCVGLQAREAQAKAYEAMRNVQVLISETWSLAGRLAGGSCVEMHEERSLTALVQFLACRHVAISPVLRVSRACSSREQDAVRLARASAVDRMLCPREAAFCC